jgi:hypothetical protein
MDNNCDFLADIRKQPLERNIRRLQSQIRRMKQPRDLDKSEIECQHLQLLLWHFHWHLQVHLHHLPSESC